jgi:hypothetical protein
MAVPYPESLPPPVRDGYGAKYGLKPLRLKMDDGGRRPIRQWASQPYAYTLAFRFTWDQLAMFEAWLHYDGKDGANPVEIPIQDSVPVEVYFTGDPKVTFNSANGDWNVSIECQNILAGPTVPVAPLTLPSWPDTLPFPEKEGYGYVREGAVHATVKTGWQDSRQRLATMRSDVDIKLFLQDTVQRDEFLAFVRNTLVGGLGWFKMPLAAGEGIEYVRAAITDDDITIEANGSGFDASFKVDTTALPMMPEFKYRNAGDMTVVETIKLVEHVKIEFRHQRAFTDHIVFADKLSFAIHRTIAEATTFVEDVAFTADYNRLLEDTISLTEAYQINNDFGQTNTDAVGLEEHGSLHMQSYAADYFAEDYVGIVYNF